MIFSMKWYYDDEIKRYRKLALRGKLGVHQEEILTAWDHYSKTCHVISLSKSDGKIRLSEWEQDGIYHKVSIFGEDIRRPVEMIEEKSE